MALKRHLIGIFVCITISSFVYSQQSRLVSGYITDTSGKAVELATISLKDRPGGSNANTKGYFEIRIPQNETVTLQVSSIGFQTTEYVIASGQTHVNNIRIALSPEMETIEIVDVYADYERAGTMIFLDTRDFQALPSTTGAIESAIKTLPGVSSSSELSSQYTVRGGSYDENLVYINDIQIYKPFLVRSGEQEGLSTINPDLVSSLRFSAGGFDATYGDKMSSVLDIQYKKPRAFAGSSTIGLLGATGHLEGCSRDKRFTFISGARYQSNQRLLSSLETKGEYNPRFSDIQSYLTYDISKTLEAGFLGNYSRNTYLFIPNSRETAFGTYSNVMNLRIFYDGSEYDKFETYLGAFHLTYHPSEKHTIKWTNSAFSTLEQESYDIQGQYLINEVDNTMNPSSQSDSVMNIGIGGFLNHARNYLDARVYSSSLKGNYAMLNSKIKWGLGIQREIIEDNIREWELMDSAGYSLPYSNGTASLNRAITATNYLESNRIQGYLQNTSTIDPLGREYVITTGLRFNYWDFNRELLISPRAGFSFKPLWEKDYLFRFSTGYYYQSPFYKELRYPDGSINRNIKAQRSVHFVAGADHNFRLWSRPFKFTTELYYKILSNLIPFKIDNVRVQYAGENIAKGYAAGMDMKVNGEFVKGIESWFSLSFMNTKEDIINDSYTDKNGNQTEPGYYPRPTDRLVNFGMYFQDYLPNNPSFRMYLTFLYGSRLPYSSPYTDRYDKFFRMPPYRRVDVGLYKVLLDKENNPDASSAKGIKNLSVGVEIFNLFNISNTISYLWVKTISSNEQLPDMFAVPNYLTSRRLNIKASLKF